MVIAAVRPRQVVEDSFLAQMEDIIAQAKRGEVVDIVVVCSGYFDGEPGFLRTTSFEDRWRLLGALEYAKQAVQNG